ncbi:MAG: mannosyltransferase YkcB-related protein [Ktedonobacteraceae bacterium]
MLPLALLLTAAEQIHIILSNPSWGAWLIPVIAIACAVAAIVLIAVRLIPQLRQNSRILVPALCLGLMALMLTSAIWSAVPAIENIASDLPVAGPSQQGSAGGFGGSNTTNTALISYLESHQGSATYLVAVPSSNEADSIILATNKAVMALGGFSGSDPILTTSQLASLVAKGTVRFFLLNGSGGGPGGGQSNLTSWVTQHCSIVSTSQYQSSSTSSGTGSFGGAGTLYDCK